VADEPGTQPAAAPVTGLPRIRDPQFREVYANASFTGMGPFDVTIIFAKSGDFAGQQMIVDQVAVTMSPQHFKNVCRAMNEALKAYENVFGALKTPDADLAPLRTAEQIEKVLREHRTKAAAIRQVAAPPGASSNVASSSTEKKPPSRRSRGASRH
jgi:Protein of unknown function (DUF3467)